MKTEERITYDFLSTLGYKNIIYEPLGRSKPPDFSIEGKIGIEVRRLNKYIKINGEYEPIEKFEFEFVPKFRNAIKELENQNLPFSIGINLNYKRPFEVTKQLLKDLKNSIIDSTISENYGINIFFNEKITYMLFKGNGRSDQTYKLIGIMDRDRGGVVQDSRSNALQICIDEKSSKLKSLEDKFNELWLVLVDNIFSRVDYTTKQDLQRIPEIRSIFKRIIMISFKDSTNWIDLYPWKI
jgi:hypothetical protein